MRTTLRSNPRSIRSLAPAAALVIGLGLLGGCGGDEGGSSDGEQDSDSSAAAPADAGDGTDDTSADPGDGAPGDGGTDGVLDNLSDETINDTLGGAIVSVLAEATDATLDGNTLTVQMDGDSSLSPQHCSIINASKSGLGATADIVLEYDDATVPC